MKMKKTLAVFTSAAMLAASIGLDAFALNLPTAEPEIDVIELVEDEPSGYGEVSYHYVDSSGDEYIPNLTVEKEKELDGDSALPAKYIPAASKLTSVKNQGSLGICWTFTGTTCAEESLIYQGLANNSVDLSEMHLAYFTNGPKPAATDPAYHEAKTPVSTPLDKGGNIWDILHTSMKWSGMVYDTRAPYITSGTLDESLRYVSDAHLKGMRVFDSDDIEGVKTHVMTYGGCYLGFNADDYGFNFADDYTSFYYPTDDGESGHAVTIVGWDDTFSKDNFGNYSPSQDGAWLCKNSWGDYWGTDGYFYVSYYEPSIHSLGGFIFGLPNDYDNIHYYGTRNDGSVGYIDGYTTAANVFTAEKNESVAAIGFLTSEANVEYNLYLYTNVSNSDSPIDGELAAKVSGKTDQVGYYTVELPMPVDVKAGTKYTAVMEITTPDVYMSYDMAGYSTGVSYLHYGSLDNGYGWTDLNAKYQKEAFLTVYTNTPEVAKPTVTATAGDGQVTLTWEAVPGATQYCVYSYDGSSYKELDTITETSYTATGLTNGTKYGFLVRAGASGTWSDFTSDDVVYATPYSTKPVLTAAAGDGSVSLKWNAVTNATKYNVYSYVNGKYSLLASNYIGTAYTAAGLTNGTKYGFLVRAYVNGAWSAFTIADIVYATPFAKPAVTAAAGDGKVTLTWKAIAGATQYRVFSYDGTSYKLLGTTTAAAYNAEGLTNGTKYGFLVRAYVNGVWSAFTTADVVYATPLSAKLVLTAAAGNGSVSLKWNAVTNATKYNVYSYTNGKFSLLASNYTGTAYNVTGLTNGTKYGFLVRAYVNGAWSAFTTADIVYATPVAKPAVTAVAGDGKVTLTWKAISGATQYRVFSYDGTSYKLLSSTTAAAYNAEGLTNGTKYGFLVRAYVNGAWSAFTTADVVYATPYSAKPVLTAAAGNGSVSLKWNAVPNATKYNVYSYVNGKYSLLASDYKGTTYTATGLANGTKYGFLVRAYVSGAWSAFTTADVVYATPNA